MVKDKLEPKEKFILTWVRDITLFVYSFIYLDISFIYSFIYSSFIY